MNKDCGSYSFLTINESILATGTGCSEILFIDLKTGEIINKLEGHTSMVFSLKLIDNQILVSGSWDKTIKLWDLKSNNLKQTLNENSTIKSVEIIDNNILACALDDGKISIWDIKNGTKINTIIHGDDSTFLNRVDNLLLLRDGNLMSSDLFSVIKIWNTTSWTLIKTIKNTGAYIMVQDLLNDEIIYFLSKLRNLYVLNITSNSINVIIKNEDFESIKILKNGMIALGGQNKFVSLFNVTNKSLIRTRVPHSFYVYALEEKRFYPSKSFRFFIFFLINLNL